MSFALIQMSPFVVLQRFMADAPPDPVMWPDGMVTHGTGPGYRRQGWLLAPLAYAPDKPSEYHQLAGSVASFDGATVTMQQTWTVDLAGIQAALAAEIDARVAASAKALTPVDGRAAVLNATTAQGAHAAFNAIKWP